MRSPGASRRQGQATKPPAGRLHIVLVSIHGLIRGHDLELGRDADTGGQTKYVVELARALARSSGVERVDLLTRLVDDPAVSADYAQPVEPLGARASIVRIRCGPPGYIRKEELWDHLDGFADNVLEWLRTLPRRPDVIHSHYADAGYVASQLARLIGVPLLHTGHSLGRIKRSRLLAAGLRPDEIETRYHIARRIEAEEETLANADAVVTSTATEIEDQYGRYDVFRPARMVVIPPGTDLDRFAPPRGDEAELPVAREIARFRREPDTQWADHIDHLWQPRAVRRVLSKVPGLRVQPPGQQGRFKVSYFVDQTIAPSPADISSLLHQAELPVNVAVSFGQFLDVLPVRASKGLALRWVADRLAIPLGRILVAGGSGADEDMMRGNTLAVVVSNRHNEELSQLVDQQRIYFARAPYAAGILEAVEHYDFLGECRVREEEPGGSARGV